MYKMKCNSCGHEVTGAKHIIYRDGKSYCIWCRPQLWEDVVFKNLHKMFNLPPQEVRKERRNDLYINKVKEGE